MNTASLGPEPSHEQLDEINKLYISILAPLAAHFTYGLVEVEEEMEIYI